MGISPAVAWLPVYHPGYLGPAVPLMESKIMASQRCSRLSSWKLWICAQYVAKGDEGGRWNERSQSADLNTGRSSWMVRVGQRNHECGRAGRRIGVRVRMCAEGWTGHCWLGRRGKGASSPQMWAASGDWKRQENRLSPGASRKEPDPTDTWTWAQGDLLCASDLQNCKTINACYFKPLSLLTFQSRSSTLYTTLSSWSSRTKGGSSVLQLLIDRSPPFFDWLSDLKSHV